MVDGDRERDRETEHTTIIERDSGGSGGGGGVLAVVLLIIVVLVLLWVFRSELGMGGGDTNIEVPDSIDVTVTNQ